MLRGIADLRKDADPNQFSRAQRYSGLITERSDMKKLVMGIVCLALFGAPALADTAYNNFTGYSPFWNPLGNPNTATYGETFTAPTNGDNNLQSFGFYMAGPIVSGDIVLSAYIATWTGTQAGTILFSSPLVDYANTGNAFLNFNTGGLDLTGGGTYVMFLSISQYYGQSSGESYISQGSSIPGLGGFDYYNNGGDFGALTSSSWNARGLSPDWAVNADFTGSSPVPEPPSLFLEAAGLLGALGTMLRRRLRA
jgi:hypothetical protein